jgi:uncharacterized protein YdeI (YjbR/CyaY-like superfamily)
LRDWLIDNHDVSNGIFVKIYKKKSGIDSVSFEEVLEEGLCFGWSESLRLKGDEQSYLQNFYCEMFYNNSLIKVCIKVWQLYDHIRYYKVNIERPYNLSYRTMQY